MSRDAFHGFIFILTAYFIGAAVASFTFDQKVAGSLAAATAVALLIVYQAVKAYGKEKRKEKENDLDPDK